jgi:hypothetical protein
MTPNRPRGRPRSEEHSSTEPPSWPREAPTSARAASLDDSGGCALVRHLRAMLARDRLFSARASATSRRADRWAPGRSQAASGPRGGEHTSRPADSGSTRRAHARPSAASKMATDVRGPLVRGTGIELVSDRSRPIPAPQLFVCPDSMSVPPRKLIRFTSCRRQAPTGRHANPTLAGGSDDEAVDTNRRRQERLP